MRHRANPRFWACYNALPAEVRQLADRCFARFQTPVSPSVMEPDAKQEFRQGSCPNGSLGTREKSPLDS